MHLTRHFASFIRALGPWDHDHSKTVQNPFERGYQSMQVIAKPIRKRVKYIGEVSRGEKML